MKHYDGLCRSPVLAVKTRSILAPLHGARSEQRPAACGTNARTDRQTAGVQSFVRHWAGRCSAAERRAGDDVLRIDAAAIGDDSSNAPYLPLCSMIMTQAVSGRELHSNEFDRMPVDFNSIFNVKRCGRSLTGTLSEWFRLVICE